MRDEFNDRTRIVYLDLLEPDKASVLAFAAGSGPAPARTVRVLTLNMDSGDEHDIRMDVGEALQIHDLNAADRVRDGASVEQGTLEGAPQYLDVAFLPRLGQKS